MLEWDSSKKEGDCSLFEGFERLFEKSDSFSFASKNSGLMVTVPELVRDIAPVRYGLYIGDVHRSGTPSHTLQSSGNEQTVPYSSFSKPFTDDEDEMQHSDYQFEPFSVTTKFFPPQNLPKSNSGESFCTLSPSLLGKMEGRSESHSRSSRSVGLLSVNRTDSAVDENMEEVPVWRPLFGDNGSELDSSVSGRKVHRTISSLPARNHLSGRNNSSVPLAQHATQHRVTSTAAFFNQFRYQRIPRAAVRKYLMNRDPKYKAKYC